MGIPVMTCCCKVCRSQDSRNKRLRCAALLHVADKVFLIDAGPDIRTQGIRSGIRHLDGVLITHTHSDHVSGLDDLRIFFLKTEKALPCLLSRASYTEISKRFDYMFQAPCPTRNITARFDCKIMEEERGELEFCGVKIRYFTYYQGPMPVTGFRIGDMAYVTDLCDYPETIFDDLKGVKKLVISALRFIPSHVHLTVDQSVEIARKVGAEETRFIHMSHDLDHQKTNLYLPDNMKLAYDSETFNFTIPEKDLV